MIQKPGIIICILLFSAQFVSGQDALRLIDSYRDSAKYYEALNKNLQAYNFTEKAYRLMLSDPKTNREKLARTISDLGTFAFRMGNVSLSEKHHRKAIETAFSLSDPNYECLYLSANNMGSIMWFASKMDSALYYFNIAISAVSKMDTAPLNKYYRPAVLYNNLAGIYGVQGKATEGINAMKKTILLLQSFLATADSSTRKDNALHFQFEATDNLAGIYKELGDYRKAGDLLTHSYQQKQKTLPPGDPDTYKSEVLIGQLQYARKEYDKAERLLLKGVKGFDNADGDFLFWKADAYSTLALTCEATHQPQRAAAYFAMADSLYEASAEGEYDNIYLQFLRDASGFYAHNNFPGLALAKAMKGYNYIRKTEGERSLSGFYQVLNLGEVCFAMKDFSRALTYSEKALSILNNLMNSGQDMIDSVKMELKKPAALLLLSKAQYELPETKNAPLLKNILLQLKEGLRILEKRRSVLSDMNDINLLIADHKDIIDFIKKITLELYLLTNDPAYSEELISFHESGLYNRIRSRLNGQDSLQFANVPVLVQKQEKELKNKLKNTLADTGTHDEKMRRYLHAEESWKYFLDTLQKNYPAYYKMRYASIFNSLEDIQSRIPVRTTLIRFMFAGGRIMALVADKEQKQFIQLDTIGLRREIEDLYSFSSLPAETGETLYQLYNKLWRPLEKAIRYNKIIIIPDGILFNINFEILTPVRINRFEELASHSILSDYTISYNYSLFLIENAENKKQADNFIAFAPGFSDESKNAYRKIADSGLDADMQYLSLLPQPFTVELAKKTSDRFNGKFYEGDNSTTTAFRKYANGHRVIHLGTHAEADNLHPQYSRLIFSKNVSDSNADNNLYLFDIYNCDLRANLAVLTACESGKPGYEDGEGLVSLAHAFNYAGSESIVTSLWEIDEYSCSVIIEHFYQYLADGMSKDEALRKAKLDYLGQTSGRALAPQYWAGLIIMGDVSPMAFDKSADHRKWIIIAGFTLIVLVVLIFAFRPSGEAKPSHKTM